jgi:hypothetical protein
MPAGLNPEDLKARLQRARFAQLSDRIAAAMNDDLAMATANFKPPPGPSDVPSPVASHRLRTSPQSSLWDRFLFNAADAYDNTLVGATDLLPPQVTPTPRMAPQRWDELKRDAARRRKAFRQREKFPLPVPSGADQWSAAGLGQLAGLVRSPESWVLWGPESLPAALAFDGLMGFGPNLLVQDMHVRAGLRDKVKLDDALRAGAEEIALERATDIGAGMLRDAWRQTRPQLNALGTKIERGLQKVSDPLRNFEAWQYLKDLLQSRPNPRANPDHPRVPASPRP